MGIGLLAAGLVVLLTAGWLIYEMDRVFRFKHVQITSLPALGLGILGLVFAVVAASLLIIGGLNISADDASTVIGGTGFVLAGLFLAHRFIYLGRKMWR